jgi:DNA-binding HxlR family transcriptional regulator
MNSAFSKELNSHVSSMKKDFKDVVDRELKSLVNSLVSEGIVNAKFDEKGFLSDISFTEEGKAFMEVLAFNLSHRIGQIIKSKDINEKEKQELKSILKNMKNLSLP